MTWMDYVLAAAVALLYAALLVLAAQPAHAHDIYTPLKSPTGQLCCGGDDCEAIDDYEVHIDGSVTIHSRRHGASVLVDAGKVTWLPVPGGEQHPVHWCGKPRGIYAFDTPEQPDPAYWTHCLYVSPGGA